ncbi:hypothetical protein [Candidatus Electrothrix sp.]|uniref:hypothetical protein n=1 Tax=Candidatus Electrothrix sp. TaxID=2170559 RepID=UPI00405641C6
MSLKKQPLITSAEDTKLKLTDVLNPDGVLHLTGNNLFFDEDDPDCSCVLQGTRSGQDQADHLCLHLQQRNPAGA